MDQSNLSAAPPTAGIDGREDAAKLEGMDDEKQFHHAHDDAGSSTSGSSVSEYAGVKQVEAVAKTWTLASLAVAYVSLFLIENVNSLATQVTFTTVPVATSSFSEHSLLSAVVVIQQVINAVAKPPMAMIANVFGRMWAFFICILFITIGYIMQAASNNVETFAAASIFYSLGTSGLQILVTVFVADTANLRWRVLTQALIQYLPFIWTYFAGPPILGALLPGQWRWVYGMFAIIMPVTFVPLFIALGVSTAKAKRAGTFPKSPYHGKSLPQALLSIWYDLDFFGLLLFTAALTLILLPLILSSTASNHWRNPSIIAMIVVGGVCLVVFPFWERSKKLAPKAFFGRDVFKAPTVILGILLAFFYFLAYYMSVQPYFSSYLLVVTGLDFTSTGQVSQVFYFVSSIIAILSGLAVAATKHIKYWVVGGCCVYLLGIGLMIKYREEGVGKWSLIGTQVCVGIGGGILNMPTLLSVQAATSHGQMAAVTAAWLTLLEVGGAVGAAVSGAIWTAYIPSKLEAYLPAENKAQAASIFASVSGPGSAGDRVMYPDGSPARAAINQAYQETMRTLLICAVCFAALMIPLSLLMKDHKLGRMDQKVGGLVIGGATETSGASERQLEEHGEAVTVEPVHKIAKALRLRS